MYRREKQDVLKSSRNMHLIGQDKGFARKDKDSKLMTLNLPRGGVYQAKKSPFGCGESKPCSKPMKLLIDEEMFKETESRHHSPNIVARLMGLDALPASHTNSKPNRKVAENVGPRPTFVDPQEHFESLQHVYKQHPRNNRSSEVHSSRRHAVDNQEFKDVYEIQEAARLLELNYLGQPSLRDKQKLLSSDLAFVKQKFMDAKRLATDEKLRHSKEFHDVLDDLYSNRNLFHRVLQEPDSKSTEHLQKLPSFPSPSPSRNVTLLKSSKTSVKLEFSNAHGSGDMYWKSKRKYEEQISLKKNPPNDPDSDNKFSSDRTFGYSSIGTRQSQNHESEDHLVPTRIVVLKPHSSPNPILFPSPHSSANHGRQRVRRSSSQCMLEEDDSERLSKDYSGLTFKSIKRRPKSSREIAREVTRQLRHGVERTSPNIPSIPSSDFSDDSSDEQSCNLLEEEFIDRPRLFAPRRQVCELNNELNSWSSYPRGSIVSKEAKKRLSERWKISHSREEVGSFRRCSGTLGEMLGMYGMEIEKSFLSFGDMINHDDSSNNLDKKYSSHSSDHDTVRHSKGFKTREADYAINLRRSKSNSGLTERRGLPKVPSIHQFDSVDDIVNDLIAREVITPVSERSSFSGRQYHHKEKPSLRHRRSKGHTTDSFHSMKPDNGNLDRARDQPSFQCHARLVGVHSDDETFKSVMYSRCPNGFTDGTKQLQESLSVTESYSEFASELQHDITSQDLESSPQRRNLEDPFDSVSAVVKNLADEVSVAAIPRPASPLESLSRSGCNDIAHEPLQKETEQPSPVSILEPPFEEDCSSSECFEKVSAGLAGLRKQLRLLRMESSGKHDDDDSEVQSLVDEDDGKASYNAFDEEESTLERNTELQGEACYCPLDDNDYTGERITDLAFLHEVLMNSPFRADFCDLSLWHSPESPLDPYLFEQLDEKYCERRKTTTNMDARVQRSERRLLFDRINSSILSILRPSADTTPWIQSGVASKLSRVLSGQELVNEVWKLLQSDNKEELLDSTKHDLARDSFFLHSGECVDTICTEIEHTLVRDMIVQLVSEFCAHCTSESNVTFLRG